MSFPPVAEQLAVLRRGIEAVVPEAELAQKLEKSLKTGVPLRVKYGIDPTGIDVHLGHTVPMRKIRQFQDFGHQAVIIIGNYTALVGDPSGRDQTRARLTQEQVETNAIDYLNQVGKVVDLSRAEVVRNGDWFGKMNFLDILNLCGKVTVAQLLTREDFAKRQAEEKAIYLHECLYPLMQAWDSVMVRADVELGGTEQLYSFMLARDLQRAHDLPQQIGMMTPILVGLDGIRRMGKSLGNYIGISEPPFEMMKKFMQLPDQCMRMYFELLTSLPMPEVEALLAGHPKVAKMELAKAVIGSYHPAGEATAAAERWQAEIGERSRPQDIAKFSVPADKLTDGQINADKLLLLTKLCASSSDARRAIAQGGVYLGEDKTVVPSHDTPVRVINGLLLWVGKKRVVQLEVG